MPHRGIFILSGGSWIGQSAIGTHDQYADEQLATMQKRICLIEFLRLWLVIVYQGTQLPQPPFASAMLWVAGHPMQSSVGEGVSPVALA